MEVPARKTSGVIGEFERFEGRERVFTRRKTADARKETTYSVPNATLLLATDPALFDFVE